MRNESSNHDLKHLSATLVLTQGLRICRRMGAARQNNEVECCFQLVGGDDVDNMKLIT